MSYVDRTLAVDGKTVRLTPLLRQMGSQDSAASRAVAVSYGLTTSGGANQAVPPDGLTGLVLVDGRLWWLGPQTRPWRPEHGGVEIVGIRIALKWGHAVLGESLHGYQDARVPVNELWPLDPALDVSAGPLVETPLNRLMRVIEHRVSGKTIDPFAENAAAWLRTGEPTVADLANRAELSIRQFHRRCLTSFGLPPSKLLRINRLHQAAARLRRGGHAGLADVAVSSGYFDQAHFCREIDQLVGERASKAFAVASNVRFVQYRDGCPP